VWGGIALLRGGFGMPDSWLAGTLFTGWALPGVALLIGVAGPQLVTAALVAAAGRRDPARQDLAATAPTGRQVARTPRTEGG
jgi:hypothetical protein